MNKTRLRRNTKSKRNILQDYFKISDADDFSLDPASLKCFLTDDEYHVLALMLDLPPLTTNTVSSAQHSSRRISGRPEHSLNISSDDKWEMSVNLGSTTQPVRSKRYKSNNPYLKFLRDPQKHATKWRKPVPIRAKDILNASTMEKSKFITDKIIGDFIKWKESICDSKDVEIDEAVMKQLFEIGIKKPENAKIFKRKAIPRDILMPRRESSWTHVQTHFSKSLAKRNALIKCTEDLLQLSRRRETSVAKHSTHMWAKCESNMKELVSSVWRNKLNFKCVQAFCQYLEQNPQIRKPEYLIQMNMFSKLNHAEDSKE